MMSNSWLKYDSLTSTVNVQTKRQVLLDIMTFKYQQVKLFCIHASISCSFRTVRMFFFRENVFSLKQICTLSSKFSYFSFAGMSSNNDFSRDWELFFIYFCKIYWLSNEGPIWTQWALKSSDSSGIHPFVRWVIGSTTMFRQFFDKTINTRYKWTAFTDRNM